MGVHERLILACDDMLAAQHCFFQSANVSLQLDFRFNGLGDCILNTQEIPTKIACSMIFCRISGSF